MIDFTDCERRFANYGGSELKEQIVYNGELYMLKYPDPIREKDNDLSYINNIFSEYIGCHIAKSLGFEVQETVLGICKTENGKEKVCVACRDFINDGLTLIHFKNLGLNISTSLNKYKTSIEDMYKIVNEHSRIKNKQEIIDGFWNMFVLDCLIGNPDRHFDNIGIVVDKDENVKIAPVFDCGSCLFPTLSETQLEAIVDSKSELKNISYNVISAYKMNGKAIYYRDISKIDNNDFKKALARIGTKIDLNVIKQIIYDTPYLSDILKKSYYESIKIRYDSYLKKEILKSIKGK